MEGKRYLVVTADDYGIGPRTSQGILDLARQGVVTGTVLLVNSPHAESGVRTWRQAGEPVELGWHPCLTLDAPVLPLREVPSLVGPDSRFLPLGSFVRALYRGQIRPSEIEAELRAQLARFYDLVGRAPTVVNTHHHVQIFRPIGAILLDVLGHLRPVPYVRCVREPWKTLLQLPGARAKRFLLTLLGRGQGGSQQKAGYPGNQWLAGVTDPDRVQDPQFFVRWLQRMPGQAIELTCHPGHRDTTLAGRDCAAGDEQELRRPRELHLLQHPGFRASCAQAGFVLVSASRLIELWRQGAAHAA